MHIFTHTPIHAHMLVCTGINTLKYACVKKTLLFCRKTYDIVEDSLLVLWVQMGYNIVIDSVGVLGLQHPPNDFRGYENLINFPYIVDSF